MPKSKQEVNIVKIKGKRYYQARDSKGRILGSKKLEGSKMNLGVARETWREYGSFKIGKFYKKETLGRNKTTVRTYELKKPNQEEKRSDVGTSESLSRYIPKEKTNTNRFSMYQCQGEYKGVPCVATSDTLYYNGSYGVREAVRDARSRFWRVVASVHKGNSPNATDPDEALGKQQENNIINYREGWVTYARNTKTS